MQHPTTLPTLTSNDAINSVLSAMERNLCRNPHDKLYYLIQAKLPELSKELLPLLAAERALAHKPATYVPPTGMHKNLPAGDATQIAKSRAKIEAMLAQANVHVKVSSRKKGKRFIL